MRLEKFRYRGFISYSRHDEAFAKKLHRALETYTLPKEAGGRRIGRFFRDEDELSGGNDVGATLKGALSESEALIVICSPAAAESFWVEKEIQYYCSLHEDPQVIACIVAGKPGGLFDAPVYADRECFPPMLRGGNTLDHGSERFNPLAVSLKADGFERLRIKVISRLLDEPFDTIWQRAKRAMISRTAFSVRNWLFGLLLASTAIIFIASLGIHLNDVIRERNDVRSILELQGQHDLAEKLGSPLIDQISVFGNNFIRDIMVFYLGFIGFAFLVSYLSHTMRNRYDLRASWIFIVAQGGIVMLGPVAYYLYSSPFPLDEIVSIVFLSFILAACYLVLFELIPGLLSRLMNILRTR